MWLRQPCVPARAVVRRLFAKLSNRRAYPGCAVHIVSGEAIVGAWWTKDSNYLHGPMMSGGIS
jgi:hypothetical protein